jgi:hypothetical protein
MITEVCELNPATLSKAATTLENAGYMRIRKGHSGRRPRTRLYLNRLASPKLRLLRQADLGLTCCFAWWRCSGPGYASASGIGFPMSSKACCWRLVGWASMGMSVLAPANRIWLRVRVARWPSRPRKLW